MPSKNEPRWRGLFTRVHASVEMANEGRDTPPENLAYCRSCACDWLAHGRGLPSMAHQNARGATSSNYTSQGGGRRPTHPEPIILTRNESARANLSSAPSTSTRIRLVAEQWSLACKSCPLPPKRGFDGTNSKNWGIL